MIIVRRYPDDRFAMFAGYGQRLEIIGQEGTAQGGDLFGMDQLARFQTADVDHRQLGRKAVINGYAAVERHQPVIPQPHGVSDAIALRWIIAKQGRSEEHTSELQSLMRISYAVFCLK